MKKVREGTRERVKNCRERKKEKELFEQEDLEDYENKHLNNRIKAEKLSEEETNKKEPSIKKVTEEKVDNTKFLENKSLEKIDNEKKFNKTEFEEIGNLNNKKPLDNLQEDKENTNEKSKNKNCNGNVTVKREKREEDKENNKKNIDIQEREELYIQSRKVMGDLEKINKNINGLSLRWVNDMLTIHEVKYVKMAMGKALERNKLDTNYISGILNNWIREGYPKTYEEMEFSDSKIGQLSSVKEKPNLRFINFEGRHYDYDELEKKLLGWQ